MDDPVFIRNRDFRALCRPEQGIDLPGIFIEHEDLAEMSSRSPQQIEAVGLRFGQSLLVPKNYAGRVILNATQCNKAAAFQFGARSRNAKALRVAVEGGNCVLPQKA